MGAFSTKNFNVAKTSRIHTAFGAALNLGRDATQAEVDAELSEMTIKVVHHQERLLKIKTMTDDPM